MQRASQKHSWENSAEPEDERKNNRGTHRNAEP
jgi:hypothetical protein